jgi:hypothetical protein
MLRITRIGTILIFWLFFLIFFCFFLLGELRVFGTTKSLQRLRHQTAIVVIANTYDKYLVFKVFKMECNKLILAIKRCCSVHTITSKFLTEVRHHPLVSF